MNLDDEFNKWVLENPASTIKDAFVFGFSLHANFLDKANLKREAKIKAKQKEFYETLVTFVGEHTKETLREFYDYWSESDRQMLKLRYEKEKTWELSKRLSRWAANNNSNGSTFKGNNRQGLTPDSPTKTRIEIP